MEATDRLHKNMEAEVRFLPFTSILYRALQRQAVLALQLGCLDK